MAFNFDPISAGEEDFAKNNGIYLKIHIIRSYGLSEVKKTQKITKKKLGLKVELTFVSVEICKLAF